MTHEELDALESILVPIKYQKGELVLKEGDVCRNFYYIDRGLMRQFYFKHGKEVTEHLGQDHSIVMCIESLFKEEPTHLQIETLEPTLVYAIPKVDLERVALHNVNIQILYRKILEESLIGTRPLQEVVQAHATGGASCSACVHSKLSADDTGDVVACESLNASRLIKKE